MSTPVPSGAPAGVLEDLSVRMARVETDVSWIKREMATKADVAQLRGEMTGLRGELKGDIASLRSELKGDIASLRGEVKGDIASLRSELKADIASLRGELKADIASLRGEVKGDLAAMETRLIKWMVGTALTCAGVAAAAATAAARLIA